MPVATITKAGWKAFTKALSNKQRDAVSSVIKAQRKELKTTQREVFGDKAVRGQVITDINNSARVRARRGMPSPPTKKKQVIRGRK